MGPEMCFMVNKSQWAKHWITFALPLLQSDHSSVDLERPCLARGYGRHQPYGLTQAYICRLYIWTTARPDSPSRQFQQELNWHMGRVGCSVSGTCNSFGCANWIPVGTGAYLWLTEHYDLTAPICHHPTAKSATYGTRKGRRGGEERTGERKGGRGELQEQQ